MASFLRSALLAVMLLSVSALRRRNVTAAEVTPANSCTSEVGHCGRAYQACCIGFGATDPPNPCECKLADGDGKAVGKCGTCGTLYIACCKGYELGGHPCKC